MIKPAVKQVCNTHECIKEVFIYTNSAGGIYFYSETCCTDCQSWWIQLKIDGKVVGSRPCYTMINDIQFKPEVWHVIYNGYKYWLGNRKGTPGCGGGWCSGVWSAFRSPV